MINLDDLNLGQFITVQNKTYADESEMPFQLRRNKSKLCGAVMQVTGINLPYVMVKLIWHETMGHFRDGTEPCLSLDTNDVNIMYLRDEYVEAAKKDCRPQGLPIE